MPIVIVMKAMGIESDQEVTQLIGNEGTYTGLFAPSLQECKQQSIFTQQQALEWLGESAQTSIHSSSHSFLRALTYTFSQSLCHSHACLLIHSPTGSLGFIHSVIHVLTKPGHMTLSKSFSCQQAFVFTVGQSLQGVF